MQQLVIIVHILVCLALVGLVLIQHGKGADVGASFGSGAANTMFGSVGPASFLMKLTGVLALIFFATSIGLTLLGSRQPADISSFGASAPVQQTIPAAPVSNRAPAGTFAPTQTLTSPNPEHPLGETGSQ